MNKDLCDVADESAIGRAIDGAQPMPLPVAPIPLRPGAAPQRPKKTLQVRCFAEIEKVDLRWVWPLRFPFGKASIVEGPPKTGKSTMIIDIAARLSRGDPMPCERDAPEGPIGTLIVAPEDGAGDTIKHRLELAGANQRRVHVLDRVSDGGTDRLFRLPDDVDVLSEFVRTRGFGLIVIDSLMSTLGGARDTYRDSDVRSALLPLHDMADQLGVAVVMIRHHTKGSGGTALTKGGGSVAFTALARSVLTVGRAPNDPSLFVVACAGGNLAGDVPSLGFRLSARGQHCAVEWTGAVAITADELVMSAGSAEERQPIDDACSFLEQILGDGPIEAKEIQRQAREAGVAPRTLERAKARLGVRSLRGVASRGATGPWRWYLPSARPTEEPDRQIQIATPDRHPPETSRSGDLETENGANSSATLDPSQIATPDRHPRSPTSPDRHPTPPRGDLGKERKFQ